MPAQGPHPSSADTSQVIADAALRLFHERGFHGTSIRDIAGEANVGIATLFHHHGSKLELLRKIMNAGFDGLLAEMEHAVAAAVDDPTARLTAAVRTHVRRHCERPMESTIAVSELRSLEGPEHDALVAKRDRVHVLFAAPIADGAASGVFRCGTPRETARAVHAMCSAVTCWFEPGGDLTADAAAELYVALALRVVGARELAAADRAAPARNA
jgi:AcrR family transcriptional regulator